MSSLGYGADFQDPYEYDFDTDLPLSALTGQDQPSDGAVLALPVSIDSFEDLPLGQIDGGNVYFCGDQGCFACFSTIEDRTGHEMRVHGQGYLQAPGFRFFEQDGNGEMTMAQDVLDFQQPVIVPETASVTGLIDIQPGQTICHVCGKGFRSHEKLTRHNRIHTGERPFDCKECGSRFAQKENLERHMRTHTGEKLYVCSHKDCGKQFRQKSHLGDHMRTHTGEKLYVCSHQGCDKAFTHGNVLKRHMMTHTGERSYVCKECGKRFSRNSYLKQHMNVHEQANQATSGSLSFEQVPDNNLEEDEESDNDDESQHNAKRMRSFDRPASGSAPAP